MKIKLTVCTNDEHGQHQPGDVIELHEAEALNYIKNGWALEEKAAESVKEKVVERAVAPKGETATAPSQRTSAHDASHPAPKDKDNAKDK